MCYNDDTLYAIPFQISTYMMYYNKDLFEQAGIEEVPTTFDQWTEAAEKISALSTEETRFITQFILLLQWSESVCNTAFWNRLHDYWK